MEGVQCHDRVGISSRWEYIVMMGIRLHDRVAKSSRWGWVVRRHDGVGTCRDRGYIVMIGWAHSYDRVRTASR